MTKPSSQLLPRRDAALRDYSLAIAAVLRAFGGVKSAVADPIPNRIEITYVVFAGGANVHTRHPRRRCSSDRRAVHGVISHPHDLEMRRIIERARSRRSYFVAIQVEQLEAAQPTEHTGLDGGEMIVAQREPLKAHDKATGG